MNIDTVSAECLHEVCSACRYDDCACECHLLDGEETLEDRFDRELDEESERNGYY